MVWIGLPHKLLVNSGRLIMQIVRNSMICPDGFELISRHVHDYVEHIDKTNGDTYMCDGGTEYLRRSINKIPAKDTTVYSNDPHRDIRKVLTWGTYGKEGDQPLTWVVLAEMSIDHIHAVLDNCNNIAPWRRDIMLNELEYRKL